MAADSLQWLLLLWLARNTDDKTLTVIRSQTRLAEELNVTDRSVRTWERFWRERGVLHVIEHGGGRNRKPARYRIDLDNLRIYAMRANERATPETPWLPELSREHATRKPMTSGVTDPSPETCVLPELSGDNSTSGVEPLLRKFGGGSKPYSGSPCVSASSDSSSEKIISKERVSHVSTPSIERPLARLPVGQLAGTPATQTAGGDTDAIRSLLATGNTEEEVARILRSRGVTVGQVRAAARAAR